MTSYCIIGVDVARRYALLTADIERLAGCRLLQLPHPVVCIAPWSTYMDAAGP